MVQGPASELGGEPDAAAQRIEARRVDLMMASGEFADILQRRTLDGRELRRAIDGGRVRRPALARDQRPSAASNWRSPLPSLAAYLPRQSARVPPAVRRDAPEIRRQVAAGDDSVQGPDELRSVEPAARDQDVVVVVVRVHDDVGAGIVDPEQIRAGDRLEQGSPLKTISSVGVVETKIAGGERRREGFGCPCRPEADRPAPSWTARSAIWLMAAGGSVATSQGPPSALASIHPS